jgi:uncharacterized iron-regulated membrane protein
MMDRIGAPPSSNYRMVVFDPGNGHVFADRMRFDGALGWLANLHYNLLMGRRGLLISGWMALGLLVLCLSGMLLWWPGVRRWTGALVRRLHRRHGRRDLNWKRLNWDLHSIIGFWCCPALIVVTWTGLYFAFPAPVRNITLMATGGLAQQRSNDEGSPPRPVSRSAPLLNVDQAIAGARLELPSDAPISYIPMPARPCSPWYITGYYRGALPFSCLASITLDPGTGAVLRSTDTKKQRFRLRALQYMFTVHFGSFGGLGLLGIAVRIAWILLGIAPAALAITGMLMFWNRKLRPSYR